MTTLDEVRGRKNVRVASIGECMVEFSNIDLSQNSASIAVAGDTLNTAIYLARSVCRGEIGVSFLTCLGCDPLSLKMIEAIASEGIDCSLIGSIKSRYPGLYVVNTDDHCERSFAYWRSESAARQLFQQDRPNLCDLERFDVVYLSGITLAILENNQRERLIETCEELRGRGTVIAFDTNYRSVLWGTVAEAQSHYDAMFSTTDVAFPSVDDINDIYGKVSKSQALDSLHSRGILEIVLRDGANGTTVRSHGEGDTSLEPDPVDVVDTTAAGDAFNGAYLAARLLGSEITAALKDAQDLVYQVLSFKGAVVPKSKFDDW